MMSKTGADFKRIVTCSHSDIIVSPTRKLSVDRVNVEAPDCLKPTAFGKKRSAPCFLTTIQAPKAASVKLKPKAAYSSAHQGKKLEPKVWSKMFKSQKQSRPLLFRSAAQFSTDSTEELREDDIDDIDDAFRIDNYPKISQD